MAAAPAAVPRWSVTHAPPPAARALVPAAPAWRLAGWPVAFLPMGTEYPNPALFCKDGSA
jgi:hypothetical protein